MPGRFARLKSWDRCYLFFKDCHRVLLDTSHPRHEETVEAAQYRLGFYLASFGMFRNGLLQNADVSVYESVVRGLFSAQTEKAVKAVYAAQPDHVPDWELVERFSGIVSSALSPELREVASECGLPVSRAELSDTLVTKILLGVFALCPAFDRNFKLGVREFFLPSAEGLSDLPPGSFSLSHSDRRVIKTNGAWDKCQYEWLPEFLAAPGVLEFFRRRRPRFGLPGHEGEPYPLMRCIDLFFFSLGARLDGRSSGAGQAGGE